MSDAFEVGDSVRLMVIPNWLLHDLPESEQSELRSCIGSVMQVEQIDAYGYVWLGTGFMTEELSSGHYSGHSFCVTRDCLELTS